jgi:hypothetical protein
MRRPLPDRLTCLLSLSDYGKLDHWLESAMGKPSPVFVFNAKDASVRVATITPDAKWGGSGSLGCNL